MHSDLTPTVASTTEFLFNDRQTSLEANARDTGAVFVPETGLSLGHVVADGYLRYRALMCTLMPDVVFKHRLVSELCIHPMNVIYKSRYPELSLGIVVLCCDLDACEDSAGFNRAYMSTVLAFPCVLYHETHTYIPANDAHVHTCHHVQARGGQ